MGESKYPRTEHRIRSISESQYGYIHFSPKKENLNELFPKEVFSVIFEGETLPNRKFDWKRNRLNLYPIRKHFEIGDRLSLTRKGDLIIIERIK